MLSNLSMLKCKVNEHDYQFLCDSNAPIFEIKEALFQFQKFVGKIEDEAAQRVKEAENPTEATEDNFCCAPSETCQICEENDG